MTYPPDDLVMVVDGGNTAHVLLPKAERSMFAPTICGHQMLELAPLHDALDTLATPWSLLTNSQYRAWPPWPCQTCVGLVSRAASTGDAGASSVPTTEVGQ